MASVYWRKPVLSVVYASSLASGLMAMAPTDMNGLAFGELVDVKDDLFGGFVGLAVGADGATAVAGVLLPFFGAGDVLPGAVAVGDRAVVLLDVGEDLVVEVFLEIFGAGHQVGGVGVFGFEVALDPR